MLTLDRYQYVNLISTTKSSVHWGQGPRILLLLNSPNLLTHGSVHSRDSTNKWLIPPITYRGQFQGISYPQAQSLLSACQEPHFPCASGTVREATEPGLASTTSCFHSSNVYGFSYPLGMSGAFHTHSSGIRPELQEEEEKMRTSHEAGSQCQTESMSSVLLGQWKSSRLPIDFATSIPLLSISSASRLLVTIRK